MITQITEKDPHTGKECTLNELAQLYQLTKATIYRRWRLGKRGIDLVAPVKKEMGRKKLSAIDIQRRDKRQRAHFIKMAKQSMLAKPMNQIADANKKVSQA